MDREAWHAAVHGVTKSWTWLRDWTELRKWNKKDVAAIYVRECSTYVFLQEFYSVQSYIWIFNSFCIYFLYVVRMCSNFILSHIACSVFPVPLIDEMVFIPLYIPATFIIDEVTIGAGVFLWTVYPVLLIYVSVLCIVFHFIVVSVIHFVLVLMKDVRSVSCLWMSNFFSITY